MRGQVKVHQHKLIARRRRRSFLYALYSLVLVSLLVSGLSYLSHTDSLSIASVAVSGNSRLPGATVESIALHEMTGSYGHLFSKSNAFLYPDDAIVRAVKSIPLVRDAEVSRVGFRQVLVSVVERKEVARWCRLEGDVDPCYSLDESGLAFAPVESACRPGICMPVTMGIEPLIYRGLIEGDPVGKRLLLPEEFRKMRFFMGQVDGLSVMPREAILTASGYMTVMLEDGGRIFLNPSDDFSTVLGNLAAIITDKTVAPDFGRFLRELDYIKLDIGNKAVYKMKIDKGRR